MAAIQPRGSGHAWQLAMQMIKAPVKEGFVKRGRMLSKDRALAYFARIAFRVAPFRQ